MAYERMGLKDFDENNPFAAKHVDHIEDGIIQNESDIASKADQTEVDQKANQSDLDKVSEDVEALNADLTDKIYNTLAKMGASEITPCDTATLIRWMIENGFSYTQYRGGVNNGVITDIPISGGTLDIYINSTTSVSGTWRGEIQFFSNANDRLNSYYIGRPTTNIESIAWYKVSLEAVNTTSIKANDSDDIDPVDA